MLRLPRAAGLDLLERAAGLGAAYSVWRQGAEVTESPARGEFMVWLNLAMKTLGGRQFWGDVRFFRGWRIQRHVLSGHYRLLDPQDVRRAWGSLAECEATLQAERDRLQLPPMSGTAVVALHGILRSSKSGTR